MCVYKSTLKNNYIGGNNFYINTYNVAIVILTINATVISRLTPIREKNRPSLASPGLLDEARKTIPRTSPPARRGSRASRLPHASRAAPRPAPRFPWRSAERQAARRGEKGVFCSEKGRKQKPQTTSGWMDGWMVGSIALDGRRDTRRPTQSPCGRRRRRLPES